MQEIEGQGSLGDASLDLSASTFCVQITDEHSPITYAIVYEVLVRSRCQTQGCGNRFTVLPEHCKYIIGGRTLVKNIKRECIQCRILHKKGVLVAMGPVGENNLTVAPPILSLSSGYMRNI